MGVKDQESVTVVQIGEWEKKREIMAKKRNLKKLIYIEDDLTREEREVQRKLRVRAGEKTEKRKKARVGYRKIQIEDKWYRWNERKGELEDGRKGERIEVGGAR